MNNVVMGGRICTIPKIRVLQLGDKPVSVCTFTIAISDAKFETEITKDMYTEGSIDYVECISFDDAASKINQYFAKGFKIICSGKIKNHYFEDANCTKHFTQVLMVNHAEFGDTEAVFNKYSDKKKAPELSIVSDLKEIDLLFQKVCSHGYLCIDEDDYFKLAMNNI
ncbi:MAG: single-stranded DNA-binding protein [Lachnospiraceae bacterium]|nr:single-stranded DNA-binding protein [Lachnospiraceae bacterium]